MDFTQYVYDFSYSMNFDTLKELSNLQNQANAKDESRQITESCKYLLQVKCFKDAEVQEFVTLLFKQVLFRDITQKINSIAEIQFEDSNKNLSMRTKLENLRLTLCQKVQEVHIIFRNQKQKYLNITILLLTLILFKIHLLKNPQKKVEQIAFFHLIHWEIKGKHSTNIAYECLLENYLHQQSLKLYFSSDVLKSSSKILTSFRQVRNSMSLKEIQVNNSGKVDMVSCVFPTQSIFSKNNLLFKKENRFMQIQCKNKLTFGNSKKTV